MSIRTLTCLFALLAALCAGLARASIADDHAEFTVIVNPNNPVTSIDRAMLRDAYLRKATDWDNGKTIRPVDLSPRFSARDRFTSSILRKTPSQLKSYWSQQIFSGKAVPPPEADSINDVISYVLANPGAIGYLPPGADPGHAKTVQVH